MVQDASGQNLQISSANINRLNDTYIKYIFAREESKPLVLSLINAIFAAKVMPGIIDFNFMPTEQNPANRRGKGARLDIVGTCSDGSVVNIEIQVENLKYMPDRSLFYWAKLFPRINSGDEYTKLKRTVCINIMAESIFPDSLAPGYCNCFLLINKDNINHILTDKEQIFFVELDKFARTCPDVEQMSIADKWCAYLSPKTSLETLERLAKTEPLIQEALKAEEKFMNTAALLEFYYDEERERRDRFARDMYVKEEGMKEGMKEGRREGMKEGRKEGRKEGLVEGLKKIAKNMLSAGETRAKITQYTGLTEQELDELQ